MTISLGQLVTEDAALGGALPADFLYGASTAAFQIEGSPAAEGKGPSVWDRGLHGPRPGGGAYETGDEACDSYVRWREDVSVLKAMGANSYRFSISWPRIVPDGRADTPPNQAGLAHYAAMVDALLDAGITPVVTLFHWDVPVALDDEYGGFESARIVPDFTAYARAVFAALPRVKHWITVNEPFVWASINASVLKTDWSDAKWAAYTRHTLLAHAAVVDMYRREFCDAGGGQIGITLNMDWVAPIDESKAAQQATLDLIDFWLGMYAEPMYHGRFPASCLRRFGEGPDGLYFTPAEWALVRGSNDFFGLNHYGTSYATGRPLPPSAGAAERSFGPYERVHERDGVPIGNRGEGGHPHDVPWGFGAILRHVHTHYTGPAAQTQAQGGRFPIYVTENGFAVAGEEHMSAAEVQDDVQRQNYFVGYVREMVRAVQDGVDVGGYMAWSLLDNLEWSNGFGPRFGITAVGPAPAFTRTPKDSAYMLRRVFAHLIRK
ncbi:hypothetical protein CspeluHIS016_0803780 [Cutaneotrichosporon spelunceum]|uniref:Beta-glucosidase n=1 Tax=Cutaneotrichosporon spelunceum TaxID=1672016 RepID=A0AAD3U0E0_9TREE|nr:hypothetical protein CspeluHIS016_0803780 [Cutaneotrichosporon spelunceum]